MKTKKDLTAFFDKGTLSSVLLFLFGMVVLLLNWSLAFDNVVWGDEAFSGITVRDTGAFGIFQRVFYLDSHPPLYYYFLKLVTLILGNSTVAYHMASLIPFTLGILVILFVVRKHFGNITSAFFIAISGLAAANVEYNLEIRMYSLVFFFVLMCALFSYCTLHSDKKIYWVFLTLFGVLAAYTHYFGLVTTGIFLFCTSVAYYLNHRGRSWLRGVISICSYLLLYAPWMYVFVIRLKIVASDWWLTEISGLNVMTTILFCGVNMRRILLPALLILTCIVLVSKTGILQISFDNTKNAVRWHFAKPELTENSADICGILICCFTMILTVGFTYVASLLINPLTVERYMYPLVPIMLYQFMLCLKVLLTPVVSNARPALFDRTGSFYKNTVLLVISLLFILVLCQGLSDYRQYRSLTKVHNEHTTALLETIGEPAEDTVFIGRAVQHLGWTVLKYYYPDNTILEDSPTEIEGNPPEIWAFLGYDGTETNLAMAERGYSVECFEDIWFGKYNCNLYHYTLN